MSASSFGEAQQTVEELHAAGIGRSSLDIVGADLRLADRPSRGTVWRSTRTAAAYGAAVGLLLGVFITLVAETSLTGLYVVAWGLVYGVLLGTLFGFFHGLIRHRPDLENQEVVATRYEVRCVEAEASVAKAVLLTSRHEPTDDSLTDAA
ncbi:general stress protein [Kribbella amoyensis]|uniref:general stress protein n=1 Tax=Kribbella amoyensis TaxID=996641 RepID=UPI0011A9B27E|nr:general stress protein [Kribbella amoyensis]